MFKFCHRKLNAFSVQISPKMYEYYMIKYWLKTKMNWPIQTNHVYGIQYWPEQRHANASVCSRNSLESALNLVLKGGKQKTRRHFWPLGNVSKHSSEHPTSNTHILGLGQVICLPWTFKGSGQETLPSCRIERHIGGRVYKLKGREMDVRIFHRGLQCWNWSEC